MVTADGRRIMLELALAAAAVLMVVACGDSRPDAVDWQERWDSIVSDVHAAAPDGLAPDRATCRDVLGALRSAAPGLEPTPDPAIDAVVGVWGGGGSVFRV